MRKNNIVWAALLVLTSLSWADEAQPANKKKATLQDLLGANAPVSQPPAVVGVRGLEETNGEIDTKARDIAAIERLEHVVIHDDELAKFIEEGKLK